MKKGDATRARIVAQAGQMASVRGLSAVSLGDIAQATGLSKSGVFKHFTDKEALDLAVLQAAVARFLAHAWTPALKIAPGRERLAFIFERWLSWLESEGGPGGCPFVHASAEFDDQPGAVRDFLQAMHRRWEQTLIAEAGVLTDPARARQAVFELRGLVMSFGQQRRLLNDAGAASMAQTSFAALLDRLSLEPAVGLGV